MSWNLDGMGGVFLIDITCYLETPEDPKDLDTLGSWKKDREHVGSASGQMFQERIGELGSTTWATHMAAEGWMSHTQASQPAHVLFEFRQFGGYARGTLNPHM